MEWNLDDLYKSITDPKISKDKKIITSKVNLFNKEFRHKINSPKLNTKTLLSALSKLEEIELLIINIGIFSSLLHSKYSQDHKIASFYQETKEFLNKISNEILWFDLEWKELNGNTAAKLLKDPKVKAHKHHLSVSRLFAKYTLSEKEEIVVSKKSQSGISAFQRLYDELLAREVFIIKTKKGILPFRKKKYSAATITPLLANDPDRSLRILASESYTDTLTKNSKTYAFILNTKLLDKKISDEMRGFNDVTQSTLLSYEIKPEVLAALRKAVSKRSDISERFYKVKSKLSGYKLNEVDRYNDVFPVTNTKYSYDKSKEIILSNFTDFSPTFGKIAKEFFDNNWIDAKPIDGKMSGAYCMYGSTKGHPYILSNFTGDLRDIETLAHELGHGIHAVLAKDNNLFEFHPSTATAEIASVFCENIIFDAIYSGLKDKKQKINFLGNRIQQIFATIYRQMAFLEFEIEIHETRRKDGELSVEQINDIYQKHLQKMFGKGLILSEGHGFWWIPVSHFFRYDFYVFTYAFGELLTHALYFKYKKEGDPFIKKYIKMLSKGGSLPPQELLKIVDINISDPLFWENGLKHLEDLVKEFEDLAKK